jgi:hypothetical protein
MLVAVDWPVYTRLAHTMRASNEVECGAEAGPGKPSGSISPPRRFCPPSPRASVASPCGTSRS